MLFVIFCPRQVGLDVRSQLARIGESDLFDGLDGHVQPSRCSVEAIAVHTVDLIGEACRVDAVSQDPDIRIRRSVRKSLDRLDGLPEDVVGIPAELLGEPLECRVFLIAIVVDAVCGSLGELVGVGIEALDDVVEVELVSLAGEIEKVDTKESSEPG